MKKTNSALIKLDFVTEQTVGEITKIIGLMKAKFLIPIIDVMGLDANPRSSRTGQVTDAIIDSLDNEPLLFPFKTKGILLASSCFERLERNRFRLSTEDQNIEGILDGGHNTLAVGIYILSHALEYTKRKALKSSVTWDDFKKAWAENRDSIDTYLEDIKNSKIQNSIDFYIPIELLVPKNIEDRACVDSFKNDLLEICAARNNNVQLQTSAKANQRGYFDELKNLLQKYNPSVCRQVEWKTNDGGKIKVQDIIALAWIPLSFMTNVKYASGRSIEPVSPNKIYSAKGSCMAQFEKLMSSTQVTFETTNDYRRELSNTEVATAFAITAQLPELYDYIYEKFPDYYNATGRRYGAITAVKKMNFSSSDSDDKKKKKKNIVAPFSKRGVSTASPEGFIVPLVCGLRAIIKNENGRITWITDPKKFLESNLEKIVSDYSGILSVCEYDPQKVGKATQSYNAALAAFKMAQAGIL